MRSATSGQRFLANMWKEIGDCVPFQERVSPGGLCFTTHELPRDYRAVIVQMPSPKRQGEAYFTAMVFRPHTSKWLFFITKPAKALYFTLEASVSRENGTLLGGWEIVTRDRRVHNNYDRSPEASPEGLISSIIPLLPDE